MEDNFIIWLDRSIIEQQRLYNAQSDSLRKANINATLLTLRAVRNKYLKLHVITDSDMELEERNGNAEVLFRDAAEDEFSCRFAHTRSNQLVAKLTTYLRHTQYGYEPIPGSDIRRNP